MSDSSLINGVEMANIKTIAGVISSVDYDDWYEEYSVDFTTQSSAAIAHNDEIDLGTRNADGATVTWTAEEDDTGDTDDAIGTLEWVNGSGLKITPGTGTNTWNEGLDSPCLNVALADCIPNLTSRDVICVQAFTDEPVTPAAQYDGYAVVLYQPGADLKAVSKWLNYRTYYSSVNTRAWQVSGHPTQQSVTTYSGALSESKPRSMELVLYFTGGNAICAHSTSTDTSAVPLVDINSQRCWVQAGAVTVNTYGQSTEPAWGLKPSELRLALAAFKVSSGTAFYNYFSSVRILRLGGQNGGAG
jgi:hypothetical protein